MTIDPLASRFGPNRSAYNRMLERMAEQLFLKTSEPPAMKYRIHISIRPAEYGGSGLDVASDVEVETPKKSVGYEPAHVRAFADLLAMIQNAIDAWQREQ